MKNSEEIKRDIIDAVITYYVTKKEEDKLNKSNRINYAGRVYDYEELVNLVNASLEFWLTSGRWTAKFETELSNFLDVKHSLLVNSGSSANLLAFSALTSPLLEEQQIVKGDEIITIACGFPTTVSPIIQYGAVPVFVDVDINSANIDVSYLEKSLSDKTKAVMVAHTLGNPYDIESVISFCDKYNLWLISDCCDSLGSSYRGLSLEYCCDIATSSFFPAHHITTGEGGAVHTGNSLLKKIMLSIRDWGKDCHCPPGADNVCKSRFSKKFKNLPEGYDHKYVYSHFGYNLKATDLQASIGCAQLQKLPEFIERRRENWNSYYDKLKDLEKYLIFQKEEKDCKASWFGFLITLKENLPFTRNDMVKYLEKNNIQTRNLFAGNITRHPCFDSLLEGRDYRIVGDLKNTDYILNNSFWVGTYPGITEDNISFIAEKIKDFFN